VTDRSGERATDDAAGERTAGDAAGEVDVADARSDLDEIEAELSEHADDGSAPAGEFVASLREAADGDVRMVARYDGETSRLLFVRADLRERYTDAEKRERLEALVMHGLGDPTEESALADYGSLNATFRWYDDAVVATYPTGEWTGIVATFDRRASPLVDVALDHLA
jgi:hypothetical protein